MQRRGIGRWGAGEMASIDAPRKRVMSRQIRGVRFSTSGGVSRPASASPVARQDMTDYGRGWWWRLASLRTGSMLGSREAASRRAMLRPAAAAGCHREVKLQRAGAACAPRGHVHGEWPAAGMRSGERARMHAHAPSGAPTSTTPPLPPPSTPRPSMSLTLAVPKDFGFVLVAVAGSYALTFWQSVRVSSARKAAGVPYPYLMADKAVADAEPKANIFNCAQRAVRSSSAVPRPQTANRLASPRPMANSTRTPSRTYVVQAAPPLARRATRTPTVATVQGDADLFSRWPIPVLAGHDGAVGPGAPAPRRCRSLHLNPRPRRLHARVQHGQACWSRPRVCHLDPQPLRTPWQHRAHRLQAACCLSRLTVPRPEGPGQASNELGASADAHLKHPLLAARCPVGGDVPRARTSAASSLLVNLRSSSHMCVQPVSCSPRTHVRMHVRINQSTNQSINRLRHHATVHCATLLIAICTMYCMLFLRRHALHLHTYRPVRGP